MGGGGIKKVDVTTALGALETLREFAAEIDAEGAGVKAACTGAVPQPPSPVTATLKGATTGQLLQELEQRIAKMGESDGFQPGVPQASTAGGSAAADDPRVEIRTLLGNVSIQQLRSKDTAVAGLQEHELEDVLDQLRQYQAEKAKGKTLSDGRAGLDDAKAQKGLLEAKARASLRELVPKDTSDRDLATAPKDSSFTWQSTLEKARTAWATAKEELSKAATAVVDNDKGQGASRTRSDQILKNVSPTILAAADRGAKKLQVQERIQVFTQNLLQVVTELEKCSAPAIASAARYVGLPEGDAFTAPSATLHSLTVLALQTVMHEPGLPHEQLVAALGGAWEELVRVDTAELQHLERLFHGAKGINPETGLEQDVSLLDCPPMHPVVERVLSMASDRAPERHGSTVVAVLVGKVFEHQTANLLVKGGQGEPSTLVGQYSLSRACLKGVVSPANLPRIQQLFLDHESPDALVKAAAREREPLRFGSQRSVSREVEHLAAVSHDLETHEVEAYIVHCLAPDGPRRLEEVQANLRVAETPGVAAPLAVYVNVQALLDASGEQNTARWHTVLAKAAERYGKVVVVTDGNVDQARRKFPRPETLDQTVTAKHGLVRVPSVDVKSMRDLRDLYLSLYVGVGDHSAAINGLKAASTFTIDWYAGS